MTKEEFLDAAAKGKGRAVIAVRDGLYRPSFHDMRRLTLRWPGHDGYQECTRGVYTAELIEATDFADELALQVIQRLARKKGKDKNRSHRRAVVTELAKRGSAAAKEAIYANFDASDDFWLAHEIIELDGFAGLDWVLAHSPTPLSKEESWRFKWWVDDLRDAMGKEPVSEWLARESAVRPEIAELSKLLNRKPRRREPKPPAVPFEEFRSQWFESVGDRPSLLQWFRTATDEDMAKAWKAMETEDDPEWLQRLARIVWRKPKQGDVDRIIERARSWKNERNPFVRALDERTDPRLRTLGFDLIEEGWIVDGIGALSWNAEAGDVPAVIEAAGRLTDSDDLHFAGLDLLTIDDRLKDPRLLEWVYEHTPCSFCRETAVRHLVDRGEAPDAMIQECLFDCEPDIREAARKAVASRIAGAPGVAGGYTASP